MTRKHLVAVLPAIVIAALALVPFRDKAYTIDDTLFLDQAVAASRDFRHPTAIEVVWRDTPARLSQIMPSGPTTAWLLAPLVDAGNVDEGAAHALVLLLLVLAIVATGSIAARLGATPAQAGWAAALVATTPAVLGMASTVMPDIPAMTFGVIGIERTLAWRQRGRVDQFALAALAIALGGLARLHTLGLAGVAAILVFERASWRRSLAILVAPIVVAGAVLVWTRDPTGGDVGSSARYFITWRALDRNLYAYVLHYVFAIPLAIPWLALYAPRLRAWLLFPLTALYIVFNISSGLNAQMYVAPFAALGTLVLLDIAERAVRARDRDEIALALWLLVAVPVTLYIQLASKYTLVAAPAVAVLIARRCGPRMLAGICGAGLTLGLAIVIADARFAGLQRRAAAELIAPHVARGERVWFAGHWGFQWYAEHAGARAMRRGETPAVGDIIVRCKESGIEHPPLPQREPFAVVEDISSGGRIMHKDHGAGFYSNSRGLLPWWWSPGGPDEPNERCVASRVLVAD